MKYYLFFFLFALNAMGLTSQIRLSGYHQKDINPELFASRWKARWISVPGEPANVYGIYHFRKSFEVEALPEHLLVHVSADNRYKLYMNGHLVSLGPARCDVYNWNFETVDLAPYLKTGKNTLAAVVWNYAEQRPAAQMSFNQTGFILQGNTQKEAFLNTDASWLCMRNEAYSPRTGWKVRGYYVAGPGENLNAALYPWGWETSEYPSEEENRWQPARVGLEGAVKGTQDYPGRLLVPSPIPPREMTVERLKSVRKAEGITCPSGFPARREPLIIPPHQKVSLLLDQEQLTTGYFSLLFGKGKGSEITIAYTEALYETRRDGEKTIPTERKGHRDHIDGKSFIGYEDHITADGGEARHFTSLWWRTWRYVQLHIETKDEPLVLEDIYGTFSAYPFQREFTFSAPGHDELNRMLDIGWRTARLCANETYMDCPYYEQLQYFGDTRIQALITLYNTRDTCMVKNAIEQGRQSMIADGITMSRYPSFPHQFISSFSLWWICTGHDYWMYRGDEAYIKTLLPAYRNVLAWYEQWLKPDHSLGYVPHWFFADWSPTFPYGEPIREKDGNSAFQDLLYVLTLDAVAEMEEALGMPAMATHYRNISSSIRSTIYSKYWEPARQLFADTYDHHSYSQHVNALAVLAGIVRGDEAAALMQRCLHDPSLAQATIYFRYYVNQALGKAGLGDSLLDNLQIWRDQMALGLTTWAEMPEPSRSDCHAWGASPNIEFYRILLGIDSEAPGFKKIRIAPSLGHLKEVSGTMPHPNGMITAAYKIDAEGNLTARLVLPAQTTGTFCWKGKEYPLKAGEQVISLSLQR